MDVKTIVYVFISVALIVASGGTALADNEISVSRTLSVDEIKAGGTFEVVLKLKTFQSVNGLTVEENLPDGWNVIEVDNGDFSFSSTTQAWVLMDDSSEGDEKTITYKVNVPSQASSVQYSIDGEASGRIPKYVGNFDYFEIISIPVQGDSSINVIASTQSTTSSSSGSSGGSGSGGGGGSSGEKYENIAKKEVESVFINKGTVKYEFGSEENSISFIQFNALKNSGKISTTIEVLKNRSAFADSDAPGLIYQNINIWVGKVGFATASNIESPEIGFKVEKDWMEKNSVSSDNVHLYRYSDDAWNKLETEIVREDDTYVYFESSTPGFSPFAISASLTENSVVEEVGEAQFKSTKDSEVSGEVPAEDEEVHNEASYSTPAIGLMGSLFALLLAGLFVEGRNKK
ncbi:PGF-pre-PGF domain-containing protein [Methanolobus sp. ZRKC2]|uniref:PGF-pre-PGF domain-containing protein n=1 Tax=Methanolobus sp. ZRKC2 TaxID=3125783 RepID=UPI00325111F6